MSHFSTIDYFTSSQTPSPRHQREQRIGSEACPAHCHPVYG
ncbi:hypothetical protein OOT55_02950 [Marinimicrobium sp. C6131]|nr:hypothetical protein [Marinimicrobium sp. C6131]UZJ45031.1 hypothetical protein OOT55_02950 [Marinimicrobium sp. C6131]